MPIATTIADAGRRCYAWGYELILQQEAERRARLRDPETGSRIAECAEGADRRLRSLQGSGDRDAGIVTATMLRDAVSMLLTAEAALKSEGVVSDGQFHKLCDEMGIKPSVRDDGSRLLITGDPLALDRMLKEELVRSNSALEEIAHALRNRIDERSPSAIVWSRRVRIVVVVLALAAGLFELVQCATGQTSAQGKNAVHEQRGR